MLDSCIRLNGREVEKVDAWLMDLAGVPLLLIPTRLDSVHQLEFGDREYQLIDLNAIIFLGEHLQSFLSKQENMLTFTFCCATLY